MKLKKIASLMLAGVMAISMLAGCSNNGETKPVEPATGVNANTVIAALDKEVTDKVTFTASSSLQTTLEKAVQYKGIGSTIGTSMDNNDLCKFDSKLSKDWTYATATNAKEATIKDAASITYVALVDNVANNTEKYIVEQLAAVIENAKVYESTQGPAKLPTYTKDYADSKNSSTYFYNFKYTGEVAVVEVSDAVSSETSYAIAFTITRTPTKVSK